MDQFALQNGTGLGIQCAGVFLIAILSFFMTRSIRRLSLDYWSVAWGCLSISLVALLFYFRFGAYSPVFLPVYIFGEIAFGLLFVAGCRNYVDGSQIDKQHFKLLIWTALAALLLAQIPAGFTAIFVPHALIMAGLFGWAFVSLLPARRAGRSSAGIKVMSVALVLLTLNFLHYVPVYAYRTWIGPETQFDYLAFAALYDMILEILLGFGTVMAVMEDVKREVEAANVELTAARDRLEILVRLDPLTEALNRHAFYSMIEKAPEVVTDPVSGCVVVIDIDNLKPINDSLGHAAGDAAIREVARSVRSVIRADDLLFRWGGDEFLILLFNISETEARNRIADLNAALSRTMLPNSTNPVPLVVSYGFAQFSGLGSVEQAIEKADGAMYARKQARRSMTI